MARWQGTTTERGYGYPHRAERKRRLALYKPGDICAHGGEPLSYPVQVAAGYLDLPHTADRAGYLPGLSCRHHNRADGAIRKNRRRGHGRRQPLPGLARPSQGEPCLYCGDSGCVRPICQVAARQAARLAAEDGMTMAGAIEMMAARVRRALSARTQ